LQIKKYLLRNDMQDRAVSPVIGVLLMVTLTLILAAIVNSYTGGLVEIEPKSPSVTLQVTYSQSGGMEIRHVSGDQIPTKDVKLMVYPSPCFGRNASQYSSVVNKSYITDSKGASWINDIDSLKPGEVAYITNNTGTRNLTHLQENIKDQKYWFNQSNKVGNTFFLNIYYHNQMIS
jgi:archaeal type IV pilus assembly protein PilA